MKVQAFCEYDIDSLQNSINEWFEDNTESEHDYIIVDRQFSVVPIEYRKDGSDIYVINLYITIIYYEIQN
ncbi:MAG: hypothetical protein ACFFDN_25120 [Candidatus Hodarchaeota archaeon]